MSLSAATRTAHRRPKGYAVLATRQPRGSPQASVVWVGRDGDDVL